MFSKIIREQRYFTKDNEWGEVVDVNTAMTAIFTKSRKFIEINMCYY